jgi:hypothetical protein
MNFSSFGLVGPLTSTGEEERKGVGGAGRVLPSIDRWERWDPFELEMLAALNFSLILSATVPDRCRSGDLGLGEAV